MANKIKKAWNLIFDIHDEESSTEDEKYISEIISSAILRPEVDKIIVPIVGVNKPDYLLVDKEHEIFISIEDNEVNISNHNFLYKKKFNSAFTESLKEKVKKKLSEERKELKDSLFENELGLLVKIKEIYK